MKSSIVTAVFLLASFCQASWSNIVKVKPDEDGTLSCRTITVKPNMFWSRVDFDGNYSCVSSTDTKTCSGQNDRFNITLKKTHASLKINRVKAADSGFYLCVFEGFGNEDVQVVQLKVEDLKIGADNSSMPIQHRNPDCKSTLWIIIALGGLCVLLFTVIVGFALKVKRLPDAAAQSQEDIRPRESQATDDLNYAALHFQPKTRRTHRPFQDLNVVYAATR